MRWGLRELRRQSGPCLVYVLGRLLRWEAHKKLWGRRDLFDPKVFSHPFLKRLLIDLNKAQRMMLDGKHEAGRFMREVKRCLLNWVGGPPPGSPLAVPMKELTRPSDTRKTA